jgi:predicted site-specific integrase-resolvase
MQGIHETTAYRWYRDGVLPVPARKVGRLILVTPDARTGNGGSRAGLYARSAPA